MKPSNRFEDALAKFVDGCQGLINSYFQDTFGTTEAPTLSLDRSDPAIVKVVRHDVGGSQGEGCIHCFVDVETGNVFSVFRAILVGNLYDESNGLKNMGAYGPVVPDRRRS